MAEKLLVGGWPFKEEDLDLSVQNRRERERGLHEKTPMLQNLNMFSNGMKEDDMIHSLW